MVYHTIKYSLENGVATLVFNRSDANNGFNIPMCQEILDVFENVKNDTQVQMLVIEAEGAVFSVGGDLLEMEKAVAEDNIASLVAIAQLVQEISLKIKQLPKPVIFCTDGAVAGAAFNMVLAADFCIASHKSKFIQAFVNVGLAPDAGGFYLMTRSLGLNRAIQLAMTGEAVSAEKAEAYGFVYKVCDSDQLVKSKERLIKRLKRGSFNSYAAMKKLVWESYFSDWAAYADKELEWQERLAFQDDFKEGVRAHAERRRPVFTGSGQFD